MEIPAWENFNPRTPCGVRPRRSNTPACAGRFQSTHPLRGATSSLHPLSGIQLISIHAPLAGCDPAILASPCTSSTFQSTHPLRGATLTFADDAGTLVISIHAPLAGCDDRQFMAKAPDARISIHAPLAGCDGLRLRGRDGAVISIHAPLAGCDKHHLTPSLARKYFNPRTPCGVRPMAQLMDCVAVYFNPRTPCGVRRHPLSPGGSTGRDFNPRTPCGVRLRFGAAARKTISFQSTHPLRGATPSLTAPGALKSGFQSTHPLRGATIVPRSGTGRMDISIHAPLAGCDVGQHGTAAASLYFNPRTPCGVRLGGRFSLAGNHLDFNPRTPCGVRLDLQKRWLLSVRFQSTHPLRGATHKREYISYGMRISIHAPLAGCDARLTG